MDESIKLKIDAGCLNETVWGGATRHNKSKKEKDLEYVNTHEY